MIKSTKSKKPVKKVSKKSIKKSNPKNSEIFTNFKIDGTTFEEILERAMRSGDIYKWQLLPVIPQKDGSYELTTKDFSKSIYIAGKYNKKDDFVEIYIKHNKKGKYLLAEVTRPLRNEIHMGIKEIVTNLQ